MINFNLQNHRPLREIVYEELKRQIMVGEIAPGTRMMEVADPGRALLKFKVKVL